MTGYELVTKLGQRMNQALTKVAQGDTLAKIGRAGMGALRAVHPRPEEVGMAARADALMCPLTWVRT